MVVELVLAMKLPQSSASVLHIETLLFNNPIVLIITLQRKKSRFDLQNGYCADSTK